MAYTFSYSFGINSAGSAIGTFYLYENSTLIWAAQSGFANEYMASSKSSWFDRLTYSAPLMGGVTPTLETTTNGAISVDITNGIAVLLVGSHSFAWTISGATVPVRNTVMPVIVAYQWSYSGGTTRTVPTGTLFTGTPTFEYLATVSGGNSSISFRLSNSSGATWISATGSDYLFYATAWPYYFTRASGTVTASQGPEAYVYVDYDHLTLYTLLGTDVYTLAIPATTSAPVHQGAFLSWDSTETAATSSLSAPTGVSATTQSSSSVRMTFSTVANASSYSLQYSTASSFTGATTRNNVVSGVVVTGLSPSTRYYFRVKAVGNGTTFTDSAYSSFVMTTTSAAMSGGGNVPIAFGSQITLPVAASNNASPVRFGEFTGHTENQTLHLPTVGVSGQILVQTASGPAWKYPVISENNGNYSLSFSDTP